MTTQDATNMLSNMLGVASPEATSLLNNALGSLRQEQAERVNKERRTNQTTDAGKVPRDSRFEGSQDWAEKVIQLSKRIKLQGDKAFEAGDMKSAYLHYSACMCGGHVVANGVYMLNRAAVCLRLKAYLHAEMDATAAYKDEDTSYSVTTKALVYRAQARRFLGKFADAEADLTEALRLSPTEPSVLAEQAELRIILAMNEEAQRVWLEENRGVAFPLEGMNEEEVERQAEDTRNTYLFS